MSTESGGPGFRESILKEALGKAEFGEAVSLVGILSHYRLIFSRAFRNVLPPQGADIDLQPLEPQAAAALIGDLFGLDCDRLFLEYYRTWQRLKDAPTTKGLIVAIQSHPYVDRLETWTSL